MKQTSSYHVDPSEYTDELMEEETMKLTKDFTYLFIKVVCFEGTTVISIIETIFVIIFLITFSISNLKWFIDFAVWIR